MAIVEATVKSLARHECGAPPTTEVSDDAVSRAFKEACRDVNRRIMRIAQKVGQIELVEGQQEYSLPNDCITVKDLAWGPAISTVTPTSKLIRTMYTEVAPEIGEELRNARRRKLDKFPYQWEVLDTGSGRKLVLGGEPSSSGDIVKVLYFAASDSASGIPDALEGAIIAYVKWCIFRVRFAYWTTNEAITTDAELRAQRATQFRSAAEDMLAEYNRLVKERLAQ